MSERDGFVVPRVKVAALDLAGTTVRVGSSISIALQNAVESFLGRPVPDEVLRQWYARPKREAIRGMLGALGGPGTDADVERAFNGFAEALPAAFREQPPSAIDGVAELFETLQAAGVAIVLQTGYTHEIATPLLDALGWRIGEQVTGLVTSDQVAASRPAPYLVHRAMEVAGVMSVDDVLAAGDMPDDLRAGTNAGARFVVGVLTGSFDALELGRERHTHLVRSVIDIADLALD